MPVTTLPPLPLPAGVHSRYTDTAHGLHMHYLEAGQPGQPVVLLLHGFPELAFSWRHQLTALAEAGFHVIAPDQRGYGRTTGSDDRFTGDWQASGMLHVVQDMLDLLTALGIDHVHAVVGHDFGSPVAAWSALTRPDVFRAVMLMSAPFSGPPSAANWSHVHDALTHEVHALGQLKPTRQHYQWYYAGPQANQDMWQAPQGLHDFLRAYYHVKSADWADNHPHALPAWRADVLADLPHYYVMQGQSTMAEAVAPHMPSRDQIQACRWLPDSVLAVYVQEYQRRGFQGGLQWYRCATDRTWFGDASRYDGQRIEVPSAFIAGAADWGVHQFPGAFEQMQTAACANMRLCRLLPHAGHWVQQEQVEVVNQCLLEFLDGL